MAQSDLMTSASEGHFGSDIELEAARQGSHYQETFAIQGRGNDLQL